VNQIYLCQRKIDQKNPGAGSSLEKCERCLCEIWIAKSTVLKRSKIPGLTLCLQCLSKISSPPYKIANMTHDQENELKSWGRSKKDINRGKRMLKKLQDECK